MDVEADDERRVEAGILFELSYNLTNGHTFIPEKKLIPATAALLNLDSDTVERGLDRLSEQERMVRSETDGLLSAGVLRGGAVYHRAPRADGADAHRAAAHA